MNIPRWSLPDGPNPVYGAWDPHLELPGSLAAIELGLVDGPVLADIDYITDYSGPADAAGLRRYRDLGDVLAPAVLAGWRARIVDMLESLLADGESWYLFVGGIEVDDEPTEEIFVGRVHADCLALNGRFTIVEVPVGELAEYAGSFGASDRVAGLVAPAGSLRAVLARLTLADAVPTGQRYRITSPFAAPDTAALARVLEHGRLFVEETDNGTRLRLVAPRAAVAGLRARLVDLVASEPA